MVCVVWVDTRGADARAWRAEDRVYVVRPLPATREHLRRLRPLKCSRRRIGRVVGHRRATPQERRAPPHSPHGCIFKPRSPTLAGGFPWGAPSGDPEDHARTPPRCNIVDAGDAPARARRAVRWSSFWANMR